MVNKKLLVGAAAALLALPALAQETDFSAARIETHRLTPSLFMLELIGAGAGNIALSTGTDGAVLVDTQFAPLNAKILAAVRGAGGITGHQAADVRGRRLRHGGDHPLHLMPFDQLRRVLDVSEKIVDENRLADSLAVLKNLRRRSHR